MLFEAQLHLPRKPLSHLQVINSSSFSGATAFFDPIGWKTSPCFFHPNEVGSSLERFFLLWCKGCWISRIQIFADEGQEARSRIRRPSSAKIFRTMLGKLVKGKLQPKRLGPTTGAAEMHSLRAYWQLQEWKNLSRLYPTLFGWNNHGEVFHPIGSKKAVAPEKLLEFITCKCERGRRGRCT